MNKIAIITPAHKELEMFLKQNMGTIDITSFPDVYKLEERLEVAPLRVDVLIVLDEGMGDTEKGLASPRDAGVSLMKSLSNPYFKLGRLMYLNKTRNPQLKDIIDFIKEDESYNFRIDLRVNDSYPAILIKELILKTDTELDPLDIKYSHVIKRKRGAQIDNKFLEEFQTEKALILEHPIANTKKEQIKSQLSQVYQDEMLDNSIDGDLKELPDISEPKELHWASHKQNINKTIIGVTGEGKSGATTAALMMATSAAEFDKTLLIDMNWDNLGLSYMVEKTLNKDNYFSLDLASILNVERKADFISTELLNKKRLHVLTLSLPFKKHIDKEIMALIISNLIDLIKKRYRFIIIDFPITDAALHSEITSKLDRLVITTPPYMNNIISMFSKMDSLERAPIYDRINSDKTFQDIVCLQTNVFRVNTNIKPVALETFNKYSETLIDRKIRRTGVYVYKLGEYQHPVLFQQLVES